MSLTAKHRNKSNNLPGSEVRTRNLDRPLVSITNGSSSAEFLTDDGGDEGEEGREEEHVPEVPTALRVRPTGNTIHVSWTPPKNSKTLIRGYTIGWGIGVPDVYSKVLDSKFRSFTITDLAPKSEYVISLRGYNNMGDGPPAYETVKTLASDTVSTPQIFPPVGLEANVLSSSAVIVKWSDTAISARQSVSDDRYYVVRYTSNFRSPSPKFKYANSTKTSVMIDDLKASTQYEFSVKAVRGRQESPWSMSVMNSTLESAPSTEPRDLTIVADPSDNPSTIRLQWQPPKQPNGQITGYVILYTTDENLSDRDWSVQALVGDKMNTLLNNLLPDTTYYFKIQARNEKGSGPVSAPVRFRTLSQNQATIVLDTRNVSTQNVVFVLIGFVTMTMAIVLLIVVMLCKTRGRDGHKRKGYAAAAASSPRSKNKRASRELNPPDLWIHHTEQLELKSLDKNPDLAPTPVLRTFQDVTAAQEDRKAVTSSYASDSLYDDVSRRTATSPTIDCSNQMISSYPSGTSTIRRTGRAKPIMIPVESGANTIGTVFEPSTGLSRPVYPRTQSYSMHKPQLCYEMGDGSVFEPTNGHYHHPPPQHMAHHHLSHNQQLHQGMQPFPAPTLSSNNVSYSSGGSSLQSPILNDPPPPPSLTHCLTTSSPSINNLTLRPLTLQSLRSFTNSMDPNAQNTPKHIGKSTSLSLFPSPPQSIFQLHFFQLLLFEWQSRRRSSL